MKRLLTILFCLCLVPLLYADTVVVVGQPTTVAASCSTCNSTNDGYIAESPNTSDGSTGTANGYAYYFTTASATCITGLVVDMNNLEVSPDVTVTCQIWSDSGGSGPSAIVGAGFTGTADIVDFGPATPPANEVLFAATQELSAGNYWAYCEPSGTVSWGKDNTGGAGTFYYTADDGSTWASTGNKFVISVIGCSE